MRIRYAAKTDVGMRRAHNEDHFAIVENDQLFLVADGMGGHASGEVAARMAADTVAEFFARTRDDDDATWPFKMDRSLSVGEDRLGCGIKLANQRIHEAAQRDAHKRGMGTTLVATLLVGDRIHIAHVGDSRAYRLRDGVLTQLTRDHSLFEDYKEANQLTPEQERDFPHKNVITRALGIRPTVDVAMRTDQVLTGDYYVLCTDGLSGMVDDPQLLEILARGRTLERTVAELVDAANRNGGTDNVTTLLLHCVGDASASTGA
jgi:serine/threonine protein phosphatase PrpC